LGTERVETVYVMVDDVGCSTCSVCAGGELKRSISFNIIFELKEASLDEDKYRRRNVGVKGGLAGRDDALLASFLIDKRNAELTFSTKLPDLHLLFPLHQHNTHLIHTSLAMESSRTERSRSRSPRRSPGPRKPKTFSGLKYKGDRDRRDPDRRRDDRDRERRPRDSDRDRDRRRDGSRERDRRPRDNSRERRRDGSRDRRRRSRSRDRKPRDSDRDSKPKEKKPTAAPAAPSEHMILVTINDRLGTKTQVPCLPSDPIKLLKAMVAAKIGRPVHEIMLKRQGERPFHDNLTCEDYAISNGVQIDLELNTGD